MRKGNTAAAIAALNCRRRASVKDSFDFEFQSRLHECETNITKGLVYPFVGKSVRICVPAFLLPKCRLQLNDRLDGI